MLLTHAVSSAATLLAVWFLVRSIGIVGAAWGLAIGDGLEAALYALFAWPLGSGRVQAMGRTDATAWPLAPPETVGAPDAGS